MISQMARMNKRDMSDFVFEIECEMEDGFESNTPARVSEIAMSDQVNNRP